MKDSAFETTLVIGRLVGLLLSVLLAMMVSSSFSPPSSSLSMHNLLEGLTTTGDISVLVLVVVVLSSFSCGCLISFLIIALLTREIPLLHPSSSSSSSSIMLGDPKYDLTILESPTANGWLLKWLAKLLGNKFFGHVIVRNLLNDNQPNIIRELAKQVAKQKNIPIVSEPLRRIDNDNLVTDEMAATCHTAIQKGLVRSYDNNHGIVGVMDYYEAYQSGSVTPTIMMGRVLLAMEKMKFLNMFLECNQQDVMEQARDSDERWAAQKPISVFDGVPIAVKDMIKVKGYRKCSFGKRVLHDDDDVVNAEDDIMVKRFRQAGAIIIGTTTMTEYGRCPLGYNSHYKGPFNPYSNHEEKLYYYSGGSSSGSICSVVAGICPIALSFDGGGSIRLPAALSGGYGLAPSFGRIPWSDDTCITSGFIHGGVNTATTTDTALAYSLLAQNEPGHIISKLYDGDVRGPPRPHLTGFDDIDDFTGLRIGVMWDYFNDADPEIVAACRAVITELENRGANVVDVNIPHLKALSLSHSFSISTFFTAVNESDYYHRDDLEPGSKIQLQVGRVVSGVEYMSANRMRGWAIDYIAGLFADTMDIFITPGCPIVAPRIPPAALECGESNFPLIATIMRYVFLANLCDGLPISIQVMGDHWNDPLLMRLSHFVEKNILQRKTPKHFVKISLK